MTRVRFVTAVMVLIAFVPLSMAVSAACVDAELSAENSADTSAPDPKNDAEIREAAQAEPGDAKQMSLFLTYSGESDKPFYDLILIVPPVSQRVKPFTLFHQISEEQGAKILRKLKEIRFFEQAKIDKTEPAPEAKSQYLLRIDLGQTSFQESLGWDLGTITRLNALRKALDDDAAKSMDQLLARLEGLRKVWESGAVINELKTSICQPLAAAFSPSDPRPWRHPHLQ